MPERLKVLMLGWELPPHHSGGLGVACAELAGELSKYCDLTMAVPFAFSGDLPFAVTSVISSKKLSTEEEQRWQLAWKRWQIQAYAKVQTAWRAELFPAGFATGDNLLANQSLLLPPGTVLQAVETYARRIVPKFTDVNFNLIHAHDWLTVPAAIAVREVKDIPMVLHIHSTEYDRAANGHRGSDTVHAIESAGLAAADTVIAVSYRTRDQLEKKYGVPAKKIQVVHNGHAPAREEMDINLDSQINQLIQQGKNLIVFAGRLTSQKGIHQLLEALAMARQTDSSLHLIIAGTGDMEHELKATVENNPALNSAVTWLGFVPRPKMHLVYRRACAFVMPSVSEPFGLVAVEAVEQGTPVIVSRQSGVAEVLRSALRVDFWDIERLTSLLLACARYQPLRSELRERAWLELPRLGWAEAGSKVQQIYHLALAS